MTETVVVTAQRPITRPGLLAWMQERIAEGQEPQEAARAVLDAIRSEGRQDALLDVIGARAIYDLWRLDNHQRRDAILRGIEDEAEAQPILDSVPSLVQTVVPKVPPTAQQGERRVNVALLHRPEALLETRWKIGGQWYMLGDLDCGKCRHIAALFGQLAAGNAQKDRFLRAVADQLADGQIVRQRFEEDELRRLFAAAEQAA